MEAQEVDCIVQWTMRSLVKGGMSRAAASTALMIHGANELQSECGSDEVRRTMCNIEGYLIGVEKAKMVRRKDTSQITTIIEGAIDALVTFGANYENAITLLIVNSVSCFPGSDVAAVERLRAHINRELDSIIICDGPIDLEEEARIDAEIEAATAAKVVNLRSRKQEE